MGRRCALTLKGIGAPWASTRTIFGMTFGDPTGQVLAVRESTDTVSKRAAFQELSLQLSTPDVMPVHRWSVCHGEHPVGSL